jgi:TonB family protein
VAALVALAIGVSAGNPKSPEKWIKDIQYPEAARRREEQGALAFTLIISPQGEVIKCEVTRSTGQRRLDERACSLLTARAKYEPSYNSKGVAVHQLDRGTVTFRLKSKYSSLEYAPDIDVKVQRLPGDVSEAIVAVVVETDASGDFIACAPAVAGAVSPQLARIACEQARPIQANVVTDLQGNAVPVVQTVRVRFRVDK